MQHAGLRGRKRHSWLMCFCFVIIIALLFQRTPCGHQCGRPRPASLEACEGGAQDRLAVLHVFNCNLVGFGPGFRACVLLVDPPCVALQEAPERGWQLGQPSCREGAVVHDVGSSTLAVLYLGVLTCRLVSSNCAPRAFGCMDASETEPGIVRLQISVPVSRYGDKG